MKTKHRKTGYYRVKEFRHWRIAYYNNPKGWLVEGEYQYVKDSYFGKIDEERINVRPIKNISSKIIL